MLIDVPHDREVSKIILENAMDFLKECVKIKMEPKLVVDEAAVIWNEITRLRKIIDSVEDLNDDEPDVDAGNFILEEPINE